VGENAMKGTTSKVQGEGDYEAARRFNQRSTEAVKKMPAGQSAAPRNRQQAQEMEDAERSGKARARSTAEAPADAKIMADLERKSAERQGKQKLKLKKK